MFSPSATHLTRAQKFPENLLTTPWSLSNFRPQSLGRERIGRAVNPEIFQQKSRG
jgi:hypothetical protein